MADLKLGTQIGGNLVWHQGILELNPVDDKLNYRDQEIMTTRGYQTMLGSIKFGTPNDVYDIESMSDGPGSVKRYLRKMRSGAASTIWHETINDRFYTISTGVTDTAPQFVLFNGDSATFQYPVYTNSPQSSLANSFARKDYVDAVDARNVAKAGDTMTGDLIFNGSNLKIRIGEIAANAPSWDAAGNSTMMKVGAYDVGKGGDLLMIRSAGAGVQNRTSGFDIRTTRNISNTTLYVGDDKVYHEGFRPTPGDLNAYTKSEVDEKSWIRVKDERESMIAPNALQSKTISAYFTNKSDVSTSWVSGFVVNGWESAYSAWSLFSGARSDTDDRRLWFKRGRSEWLPSSRIYHEDDKPTNDELNLVSRAGDNMTGILNMKVPDSMGYGKYSIKLNNGSIGGINQLVFGDPSDTQSEGIAWPKTGKNDSSAMNADYDMLWAIDGSLRFNGKETYGEWNKPNHNDVGAAQRVKSNVTSTAVTYTRICAMTANICSDGNGACFLLSGGNNFGNNSVPMYNVSFNTRTYSGTGAHTDNMVRITLLQESISEARFYAITVGSTVELWMQRPIYSGEMSITVLNDWGLTVHMNTASALPAGDKTEYEVARVYTSMQKPTNNDLNLVSRAGDTMTGALTIKHSYPSINFIESDAVGGEKAFILVADGGGIRLQEDSSRYVWHYSKTQDSIQLYKPEVTAEGMGTKATSLATKAYVDTKVGTAVQSVTATGAVKSTGGINPVISLINATNSADGAMSAADKAKLDGLPSAAVNKTGDDMTGNLTFTNDSQLIWSRNTDWAKIGFKNDSDADTDSYMWFETGDNKNEYFKFRMHNTTGPKHEVLDIKLEGSTFSHDVILKARESNAVKLTNAQTEYTGNTGVERIIGGITSQWYKDNLVFGHVRSTGEPSAGFGIRLNDNYLMRVTPDRRLATGALVGDSYVAVAKNDRMLAMEVDTTTKVPYISVDVTYQAIRFENDRAITMPAGALNVASNVSSGGDVFAKSNVNVTGQEISFADGGSNAGNTGITTVRFIEMLTEKGAFKTVYWCGKASWHYAGNNVLTDTGYGNIHLAGCIVEVIGTAEYMIRITTPTITGTSLTGAQNNASKEFIYVNHGSAYAPGWRRGINSLDVRDLNSDKSAGDPRNTIPYIKGDGVMEISTFIDMHRKDSTADFDTRLECGSAKQLLVTNSNGTLELGAQNTSYAHIYTDRPSFYMNKGLTALGALNITGNMNINNGAPTIILQDTDHMGAFLHNNGNLFYILRSPSANNGTFDSGPNGIHPMTLNLADGDVQFSRNGSFNDVQIRSDIRLKSNLIDIKGALDKVCSLTGKTFDKFGCDKREAGIIAQDLQKVLPEAVGSFKNTAGEEYLTVSNSGVNALLVEAIKELRVELNELKSKLN